MTVAVALVGEDKASKPIKDVTTSLKGMEQQAEHTGSVIGGLTSALGKIGLAGLGISAITTAVGGLAGALGVGLNAEMENIETQLKAFTGSGAEAKRILGLIREEADKTPFAFKEMADATAALLPISKQTGVGLMDLVKQAEILAALNPAEGLAGAAFSLREAMGGDFVSIVERFNLPRQRLKELKEQGVPALKAVQIALKEMGVDASLVAGMANTLTGRWSTFQDTIAGFQQKAGAGLFDALKEGLGDLQTILDENKDAIGALAQSVGRFVGGVGRGLIRVVTGLVKVFLPLATTLRQLGEYFVEVAGGADPATRRLFRFTGVASDVADVVGKVVALGRGLVTFFTDAARGGLALHNAFERLVGLDVANVLIGGFERLRETFRDVGRLFRGEITIGDFAVRLGTRIVDGLRAFPWTKALTAIRDGIVGALGTAASMVGQLVTWLSGQVAKIDWRVVWSAATGFAAGLVSGLGSITGQVVAWLKGQWAAIPWAQVWASVTNIGQGLVARLGTITGDVVAWLKTQWAAIDWKAVWSSITGLASGLATGLGKIASTVTEWVKAQWAAIDWGAVWTAITGHVETLAANLKPVTEPMQKWLTASAADVDWNRVWGDARTAQRSSSAIELLFQHQDSVDAGRSIGQWLGRALDDGLVGFLAHAGGPDTALRVGAGLVVLAKNAVANAGPMARLEMRALGLDIAMAIVEGFVSYLSGGQALARMKGAIDSLLAQVRAQIQAGIASITSAIPLPQPTFVPPGGTATGGGSVPAFANGGSFRVGGSGGTDSQMVRFRATPGEVVAVGHPRSGGGANVTINLGGVTVAGQADEERLVARLVAEVEGVLTDGLRGARGSGVRFPLGVSAPASG